MKEHWRLKELSAKPQVQFHILKRCLLIKRTGISHLCLNEKCFIIKIWLITLLLFIVEYILSKQFVKLLMVKYTYLFTYLLRNKLISRCRHENKFNLANCKTWRRKIIVIFWYHCIMYCKFAVISGLNDRGDMKLLVQIHVLFY